MKINEPDFTNSIFSYIDQHYKRWVDFAAWHCKKAGTIQSLFLIMQEVEREILSLKTGTIVRMMHTISGNFTELDLFALRAIKARVYNLQTFPSINLNT
jgi:hypothetical protein